MCNKDREMTASLAAHRVSGRCYRVSVIGAGRELEGGE